MEALDTDAVLALEDEHREIWDRLAGTYVSGIEPLTGAAVEPLLDAAQVHQGTALLDIGTGPGTVIGPALARGAVVHAVDLTPAMVDQVRARHPDVDARVANASSLPYADESFDAVTLPFSLQHMAEPAAVFAEARRVLRHGGRLAFTVWAPDERLEAFGLALAGLEQLAVEVTPPAAAPLDGADPSVFPALLADVGFVDAHVEELPIGWDLRDPAPLADLFDRFIGLDAHGPAVQARYAAIVDAAVREWAAEAGTTVVPNPALLVAATRTG
jgi:SAM-dependent methyltransferase